MPSVNVSGVREARLAATALRNVDAELRKAINAQTRGVVNPIWREAVDQHKGRRLDDAVLRKGARVATGARAALVAASSRRALTGGLVPADEWAPVEFGANRAKVTTYRRRSRGGGTHAVTRHTARQLPTRSKGGRVLYPAVKDVLPRIAALWSQTAVRLTFEALRKGD